MNVFDTFGVSIALWSSVICILIYAITRRDRRISKFLNDIPGPPDIPFVGNLLIFVTEATNSAKAYEVPIRLWKTYGPCYRLWAGNKPYVILAGAKECEKLLTSSAHLEKSDDYRYLKPWIFDGLFLAAPAKWHSRRKLITPAFHFKILEEFTSTFNEKANLLLNLLNLQSEQSEGYFNIAPFITRCALDIICETAMGVRLAAQENTDDQKLKEYVDTTYKLDALISKKNLQPLFWIDSIWNLTSFATEEKKYLDILHNFTAEVIQERRLERQKYKEVIEDATLIGTKKRRKAFLDLLMDAAEPDANFSDSDYREEIETFMVAGHETTATSLLWAIFLIANHPEYQKQIQDEIESVVGARNVELSFSDIPKLTFLDACIKESLRMFPPGVFTFRKVGEDITLDDGTIIPKGVTAAVLMTALHRDPKFFPNPDVYNPHRFLNESIRRHPFAFIPFSAGSRNCIGKKYAMFEMKVILAKIFSNFNVQAEKTLETISPCSTLILRPEDGLMFVKLIQR